MKHNVPTLAYGVAADFDNGGNTEILFNNHGQPNRLFRVRNGTFQEISIGEDVGSGYLCRSEGYSHVGWGHATEVDALGVTWPDGHRRRIKKPKINEEITIYR